jgi:DNA-binding MarR family transcriptional regulator
MLKLLYIQQMAKRPVSKEITEECLCSPVRQVHRALSSIYEEALRPVGLTISQLTLLVAIDRMDDGATPTRLAKALLLQISTVTRDLVRLEENGWVVRREGKDARQVGLSLSAAGERLLERAVVPWREAQALARKMLGPHAAAGRAIATHLRDRI